MFKLLVLIMLLGGWVLAATSLHVVRTPSGMLGVSVVTKNDLAFEDTYVDTRAWTIADVPAHRDLVRRLIATNKTDVLNHVADPKSVRDVPTQLADAVERGSDPSRDGSSSAMKSAITQLKASQVRTIELAKMMTNAR